MVRVFQGAAVVAIATTSAFSGPAHAGGYVPPVIEIAYQAAKVNPTVPSQAVGMGLCGDSPEVCALIVLLLIGGVLASSSGDDNTSQTPIPTDPGDEPEPTDPTDPTGPTDPTDPTPPPAPIPLGPTAPLLLAGVGALAVMRRKRAK